MCKSYSNLLISYYIPSNFRSHKILMSLYLLMGSLILQNLFFFSVQKLGDQKNMLDNVKAFINILTTGPVSKKVIVGKLYVANLK